MTSTPALVKDFFLVLERLEIPFMVGGSFASSLWGKPRQTLDLDLAVLTKLRWFVLRNRVSDKQWNDIVQVLEMQKGSLDEDYMTQWATHFDVLDLLKEAQSQVVV